MISKPQAERMVSLLHRRDWRACFKLIKQKQRGNDFSEGKKDQQNEEMGDNEQNTSKDGEYEEGSKIKRGVYDSPGSDRGEESKSISFLGKHRYSHTKLFSSLKREKRLDERSADDMNMKIGDVVYLKYTNQSFINTSNSGDYASVHWTGYMSGDGLASDAIYCSHKRIVQDATVTKFLFRIEPARKYIPSDKQTGRSKTGGASMKEGRIEDKLREAENEERLYQEHLKASLGQPIYYGQSILLKHIYSGKYVALHPNRLARQVGSVKVGFVEADTEMCSMKILPSSRIKKIGDPVSFSDAIVISNSKEDHYFMHVSEFLNHFDSGLEINGSESKTEWKPKLYVSDQQDNSLMSKSSIVAPGVVVMLHNKHISGYLSATPINLDSVCSPKEMVTTGGAAAMQLHNEPLQYIQMDSVSKSFLNVTVEIRSQPSFYALWEIQKVHLFDNKPVTYYKENHLQSAAVRIKNLATQQYLAVHERDDSKLVLTGVGQADECVFYFENKSGSSNLSEVSTEELIRIKSYKGKYIFPLKTAGQNSQNAKGAAAPGLEKDGGHANHENEADFDFRLSDKVESNASTFELVSKPKEVIRIANQLSSIFFNLTEFYSYLQEWGMVESPPDPDTGKRKPKQFKYDQAFETEKELEIVVKDLKVNLDMIYQYLSSEISLRGNLAKYSEMRSVKSTLLEEEFISYDIKKKLLIDQKIMDILFRIAELIFFKTRESLQTFKAEHALPSIDVQASGSAAVTRKNLISLHQLKNMESELDESLPQVVARYRLDNLLTYIFKIMHLAVWDSEDCSNYLALKFGFFQKVIDFYPKESMDVMRESAKNITNQESEYVKFYKPWIEMLEEISEKQGNIKKQIFLLHTLSGLILDESINEPIEEFQTNIFNSLFKGGNQKPSFLQFHLNSSGSSDSNENTLQIIFRSQTGRSSSFKDQNPTIQNCVAGNATHGSSKTVVSLVLLSQNATVHSDFIYYIAAYIKLLTNLCKGRKEQYIKEVSSKDIGLDAKFCRAVLEENRVPISPIIKGAIAEFFTTAFLDRFPLRKVSQLEVNCFEFDEIDKQLLTDYPIKWINGDNFGKRGEEMLPASLDRINFIMKNLFYRVFHQLP